MDAFIDFVSDPGNWTGDTGIAYRALEHIALTFAALLVAALIALPVGLLIGHTGRGSDVLVIVGNVGRWFPVLGVLVVLALNSDADLTASLITLVVLGIPPMLAGTNEAMRGVAREVVDAARGIGMLPHQVLWRVEVPAAAPTILAGVRASARQLVAMTAVSAYIGTAGLGRLVFDGLAERDYGQMATGAVAVAVLAVALDLFFLGLGRLGVGPGINQRTPAAGSFGPGTDPPEGDSDADGGADDDSDAGGGSTPGTATSPDRRFRSTELPPPPPMPTAPGRSATPPR